MTPEDATYPEPDVSEEAPESEHWIWAGTHRPPLPRPFVEYMTRDWAERPRDEGPHPAVAHTARRRDAVRSRFEGKTLVVPSGGLKVRANDTDFRFRPGSDFFWLTACDDNDAVLVVHPAGHDPGATLYVEERRAAATHRFFSDARYGEVWVGPRRGLDDAARRWGVATAPRDRLEKDLVGLPPADVATLRGYDARVDGAVAANGDADQELATVLSELRLVKDGYEVERLQEAVDMTIRGFEDVVRALPTAIGRTERVIEGVFNLRARYEGNDVGYGTIAAAGSHATILHWTRNDGVVRDGDLLLLDAGVEGHDLYTADVTRTLPVSGTFSRPQRAIYELVLAAQRAGIEAVRPGAEFLAPNDAAKRVLAQGLFDLGILDVGPDEALRTELPVHARYTLHGVSHMLGIDVHDCAHARERVYYKGALEVGYVLTVEPGLYFQPDDLTVPEQYRGIGVRIEDDVVVTEDGCRVLSGALPRDPDEIETWMAGLLARPAPNLGL
ncbi:MAG TPA: aminopeptidase P family protein [Acidimicrobiales bacterium]|nr:aminopeptidase P family protein [Acidimicrobiales bacterium]